MKQNQDKEASLTKEDIEKLLSYDPFTGVFRWKCFRGGKAKRGAIAGAVTGTGYVHICIKGRHFLAHRVAWFLVTGFWPTNQLDHKNGDRTANYFANLREKTNRSNSKNAFLSKNNTSGANGVRRWKGRWVARLGGGGKTFLGYYKTKEEAVTARKKSDLHYGYTLRHGDKKCESM